MKILFRKWKWRRGFSAEQLRLHQRVEDAVNQWVEQKGYTKPIPSFESLAADIGIPSDQLSVYIRMRARKSVLGWRKALRIREAQQLLLDYPDVPISVVGEMVGIDDKTNFKRQFEQIVGMSPRAWREKHLRRA